MPHNMIKIYTNIFRITLSGLRCPLITSKYILILYNEPLKKIQWSTVDVLYFLCGGPASYCWRTPPPASHYYRLNLREHFSWLRMFPQKSLLPWNSYVRLVKTYYKFITLFLVTTECILFKVLLPVYTQILAKHASETKTKLTYWRRLEMVTNIQVNRLLHIILADMHSRL